MQSTESLSLGLSCMQIWNNKPSFINSKCLGKCPVQCPQVVSHSALCLPALPCAPGKLRPLDRSQCCPVAAVHLCPQVVPGAGGSCPPLMPITTLSSVPNQVKPHQGSSGHLWFCLLVKSPRRSCSSVLEVVVKHLSSSCELPVPHKITNLLTVSQTCFHSPQAGSPLLGSC